MATDAERELAKRRLLLMSKVLPQQAMKDTLIGQMTLDQMRAAIKAQGFRNVGMARRMADQAKK